MAQNINQNGNFHTPLSPMRFQSSMGKEVKRKYKDGKNMVRLSLARVVKVNYKYNTVDVVTIKDKNSTVKNPNDNGKFSARLPVQFGGQTPDGKVYGTNTLVTVGSLVLIGYLEGHKDNPIVINIYGGTDNQSMLTRTTFTGADESDEDLQQELWQLFTLYPSMTYKNIDGHGNQEVTFPGKTFFYASADDSRVNDAFFDYDHLPSSHYANGDLIEPTSPDAPNMLYVHQSIIDNHRVTFFVKSDGTVRVGSRHDDGKGVTFWQLNTDGSFRIQQSNDTVDPEDKSSNFSSFSIEEDGTIALQSGSNILTIGKSGLLLNGGAVSGGSLDLSDNQTIKDMQGDITTLQQATTSSGIVSVVTESTPWQNINNQVTSKAENFVTQPVPPYNIGDIWKNGSSVYVCTNPKAVGATFSQTDWTLSADVTSQNTAGDTQNVNGTPASTVVSSVNNANSTAQAAQTTAQAKTEMFLSQPTPPYNKGDIWNDNGVIYVSNITRPDGATFLQADWVKSADVTANNTANDTANVNGTPASTLTSNVSNAQSTASSAQSTASTAQSTANTAQSTANSKAKTFTSTPTVPYNLGDMWNQGGKVYSCTTPKSSTGAFNSLDWVLVADLTSLNTANDTSNVNGTTSSTVISNISNAQSTANSAQSLATSKAKAFVTQPTTPYSVGDVWDNNSTVYICQTARSTGAFVQSDWTLSADVTANNTAADTTSVNGTASSTVISNINNASSTASAAQSLAQSKAKGFITQPTPPYSVGDVWDNSGTVYICNTAKASGTSFAQSDWTLAGDVTANNTAKDTSAVNGTTSSTVISNISNAQSTANSANTLATSKAKGFVTQPVPPYSQGDVWDNSGTVYICTTARSTGSFTQSDWTLSGDVTANNTSADTAKVNGVASATVNSNITSANTAATNAQTTANSKAKTFTATPTLPYNLGDIYKNGQAVYVCTTARSTGSYTASDFTLVGDVTSQNTAADTSAVNGTASSTVISNISTATTNASNAQTAANNAQTTANSKAQGFVSQPVPPYNTGDVWNNSGTVYVCTTAKASGTTFSQADWTLSGDVTANNTAKDTSAVNGTTSSTVISNISTAQSTANTAQTTANSKAQGFTAQPVPPYNKGDVWNNGGTVYICTTAKASGTTFAQIDWTLAGDVTANNTAKDTSAVNGTASSTVISNISNANTAASNAQTTANSKAQTFTATPTVPYNLGDIYKNGQTVYVCTTARPSGSYTAGDWTLVGDVTANNTAADTAKVNGTTASTVISNISNAQTTANNAQTSANSKAKTFTSTPTAPYSVGDLYQTGGKVYVATVAETTTYNAADWVLAGDVTSQNTASDTSNVGGVSSATVNSNISSAQSSANNAQTTANSKAKTYTAQPAPPYNTGDVWQTTNAVYICTAGRSSGSYTASDWYKAGDVTSANTAADTSAVNGVASATVNSNISTAQSTANTAQSTANSKAKTWTAQPVPPYSTGDIWQTTNAVYICTAGRSSGSYTATDWYKAGDVTSANTANDTSNVNGTASSTVTSNISSAQTAANNAQNTANSKAKTWTAQPVPPYSVGDIWQNGGSVYVCTTARASGSYTASDWYKAGDVTSANTAADTSNVNGVPASTVTSNASNGQSAYSQIQNQVGAGGTIASTSYADGAVGNLIIGGRNYLRNTYQMNDLTNWSANVGSAVAYTLNVVNDSVYGGVIDLNVTTNSATGNNWIVLQNTGLTLPNGKFTVGNKYTVSFLIWNALQMYVGFADSSGSNPVSAWSPNIPVNTGWTKIVYTFTATATGNTPEFYLGASDTTHTGHVYVTQVQLEDGSKATGYHPAPEDVQNQISTVTSSVNNIQQGIFPSAMGSQIVNQVTSSNDYISALNSKANSSDLTGLATSTDVDNAVSSANDYTNKKIQGIDFSPYVQNSKYTQDKSDITAQFTQSGGVNMLLNSVGYNGTQFWNPALDTGGRVGSTVDTAFAQYGSDNAFSLAGGSISQTVTVTPNVTYTLSAYINKGTAGTGYMKLDDGKGATNTQSFVSGTAYSYTKYSISVTPTTSSLTVTLYGDTASAGLEFGCVILNVGSNPFTWQQHMGEVYNANIIMDLNGIQVQQTDNTGKVVNETLMSPAKFAGYADLNNDGVIDTSTGSVDEVFRLDKDTFRMNSATIGPVKIIQTSGTYNGIAFIPS